MLCLPNALIINNIFSHLYPSDLEKCKEANPGMKSIIENNEEYIDKICQHIQPHGEQNKYYNNGQLKIKCYYKEGKKCGERKKWYENGQLRCQKFYKDGKEHGESKHWYKGTGQIWSQCYYKDGKLHGEFKEWYEGGHPERDPQLSFQEYYKDGEVGGRWEERRGVKRRR